jgi:hypothetical protein
LLKAASLQYAHNEVGNDANGPIVSPFRLLIGSGAALTYARRYALFTLVGIAGEDDLDAPDLYGAAASSPASAADRGLKQRSDQSRVLSRTPINGRGRGVTKGEPSAILDGEQSATLRDSLLAEVGEITSVERASSWAGQALAAKNKLVVSDAKPVEDAFEQKAIGTRFS